MTADVRAELHKQGFEDKRIHIERMLNMRFEGTSQSSAALTFLLHANYYRHRHRPDGATK
jgi:5-oxoprolinase (ATP-hydrolysing)